MEKVSYAALRKNFKYYVQRVNHHATALVITNFDKTDHAAVLMSKHDYDSMIETVTTMSNPALMAKIRRGQAQIASNKTKRE